MYPKSLKIILSLLFVLVHTVAYAQETQYDQMKKTINENSLPLVNMIVDVSKLGTSFFVTGKIEITDYQRRTLASSNTVRYRCKYRIRGGSSVGYDKKSFAVKLCDVDNNDVDANIFGIREENSWILDAMAIDRIRMRNRVCFDVWNETSHTPYETKYGNRNGTKGLFVELFINGDYHGLYCMSDKIDRKLLGLKKAKVDDNGVQVRGLLYKGVSWESGYSLISYDEADVNTDMWNAWELKYPEDYPSMDTWRPLMDLIDFCSVTTPYDTFKNAYQDYFYTENLCDYVLFTMALNVGDNGYKNTYLSVVDINKGHKYLLTPWDMDMSLGGYWNGAHDPSLASINRYDRIAPFYRLSDQNLDGFQDLEVRKWKEYATTHFSCDSINRRLDDYGHQLTVSGAWEREYQKWNGNPVPLQESIFDELDYVKDWYKKNYDNLCAQFDALLPSSVPHTASKSPDATIFTPDGIPHHKPTRKGLYIMNGKKVFFK